MRKTVDDMLTLRPPALWTPSGPLRELFGTGFLDVEITRELTINSYLYAHHLVLHNPS